MNVTDLDGAAHERTPLVGLVQDAEHVGRNVLPEIKRLGDASREILHSLAGSTTLQRLVRTHQPGGWRNRKLQQFFLRIFTAFPLI